MIDNNLFQETPTNFELNGPTLSFTTQPVGVATTNGSSATFIGIATATFPQAASNSGSIAYQWYDQNGAISNGTYVTGAATTTLTISRLVSPTDHNRQIYLQVDYVPSGVTGNALNEPANSNVGIVTVYPSLSITTQPAETTSVQNVSATFSIVASVTDTTQGDLSYKWYSDGVELTDVSPVSGSSTPNLTIASSSLGTKVIKCVVSHPTAGNSPLSSNEVYFNVIYPRPGITIEKYDTTTSTASVSFHDLQVSGDLTLLAQNQTNSTSLISLYASEKDTDVEMEIYGGSGASVGSYSGGKGGFSKVRMTMKKNEEYTIAGLDAVNNCPFVYRKGSLIAVVGKGGDAASGGSGGDGGGINISGTSGGGRGGGNGGQALAAGTLPSNGIFGSSSSSTAISPDTKATGQTGGRALPCPKGNYWISKGYSACADVGASQIYLANGTVVANSSVITRGFKSGYDIRQTAGAGVAQYSYTQRVGRTCNDTTTRSAVVTHVKPTGSSEIGTISVSGDSFDVRAFDTGSGSIGGKYYEIYSPISISSYSITDVSSTSAGGGGFGVYLDRSYRVNDTLIAAIFASNGGASFTRSFRITVNQSNDYDCSYDETVYVAGGGSGGAGATGGNGGSSSGSAGGGGSGYTDGSITVLSTLQGSNTGGAKIIIKNVPIKPVLSVTSNIATTYSTTAGNSNTFSISVSDVGNSSGTTFSYQWYLSTDGGSSYTAISGETGSTLDRYSTFYYSDNNNKFFCRTTAVNVVGTTTIDSNICTLTVARSSYTRTDPSLPSSPNWNSFQDGSDANVGRGIWGGEGAQGTGRTIADIPVGTGKFRIKNNTALAVRKSNAPSGTNGCTQGRGVRWQAQARISIYRTDGTYAWSQHDRSAQLPVTSDDGTFNWEISLGRWDIDSSIELDPNYAYRAYIEYNIGRYSICNCNGGSSGSNVSDCRDTDNYAGTAYRMYDSGYYAYTPAVYSYEARP